MAGSPASQQRASRRCAHIQAHIVASGTHDDESSAAAEAKLQAGVTARNDLYASYEQVDKSGRDYQLAEASTDAFDETFDVASITVDFSLSRTNPAQFAQQFGGALERIGFAVLINHGVSDALLSEASGWVRRIFTETSSEVKRAFDPVRHGSVNQGYFGIKETSNIHPDLVEGWVFCRRAFRPALEGGAPAAAATAAATDTTTSGESLGDFWPAPEYEQFFSKLVRAELGLAKPLLGAMLRYLGHGPDSAVARQYASRLDDTAFGLRLNYYPPVGGGSADAEVRAAARGGAGRMLGHEDMDMFTLLSAPDADGLQVLDRASGKWVRLNAPRGSIIINTGDYMQRISNDRLLSTTHRVALPRAEATRAQARTSFPVAIYVREEEILEVLPGLGAPKYPPVKAIDFHVAAMSKYYGDDYRQSGSDGSSSDRA